LSYTFQFGVVVDNLPRLLAGAGLTLQLSVLALVGGLALAVACAVLKTSGPRAVRAAVSAYVEIVRNTPFLVQLFIIYFSLPAVGIRLDANVAALVGMIVNFGGYATEIVRAGIESVPRGQIEAGRSLGLSRLQVFRFIVLFPALKAVYPALASQFILLMLGSSIVSAISAEELTAVTNTLQSTTFRAFEFYFATTALYLAMAVGCRFALASLYWFSFVRGRPV
jgi:polar amino acid transport system permease protein